MDLEERPEEGSEGGLSMIKSLWQRLFRPKGKGFGGRFSDTELC
jgi:hypothetical protein